MFEQTEQTFFRKILNAHSKTPIECLYLEIGALPLRFHLMSRRIMYLWSIMQRENEEITKQVVLCQKEKHRDGDFFTQTKANMEYLSISDEDLCLSKSQLKDRLTKSIKQKAFQYLMDKAMSHSKVNCSCYSSCEGTVQYQDARFTPDLVEILFKFRTRTYLVKNNFRNNYRNTDLLCPICGEEDDSQEHIFSCKPIWKIYLASHKCEDI